MRLKKPAVLITAGPTTEMWDDIRFLSNRSSARMGYALGEESLRRGVRTTLVSGAEEKLPDPARTLNILSARDMFEAVKKNFASCDIFIAAAAVCDFRPRRVKGKIKKREGIPDLKLLPNPDILKWAGQNRESRVIAGFSLQEEISQEEALNKMKEKNCDLMILNTPSNLGSSRRSFLLLGGGDSQFYGDLSLEESAKVIIERCLKVKSSC